jgi:hypothetical protein
MEVKSIRLSAKTIRVRMLQMRLRPVRRDPVAHCWRAGCGAPVWSSRGAGIPRELFFHGQPVYACGEHAIGLNVSRFQ